MSASNFDDLVSVEDAVEVLGVSRSQVHNLCKDGLLVKVKPSGARKNHPPHAKVITRASLDDLVRERSHENAGTEASAGGHSGEPNKPRSALRRDMGFQTQSGGKSSSKAGEVQALKVQLDQARAELKAERARTAQVANLLVKTAALLQGALASREPLDDMATTYSNALTELLVEDDPGSLAT